jgi:hypothetical protein
MLPPSGVVVVGAPVETLAALLQPLMMAGVWPLLGLFPEVGEHTEPVLRELEFDVATDEPWRATGVV